MPLVTFIKQDLTIEVPKGANLREVALENKIDLYPLFGPDPFTGMPFPAKLLNCRGKGFCATCRIKVNDHRALSPPTVREEKKVAWEGKAYRLACQTQVLDDVEVETNPRRLSSGWMDHPTYEGMKKIA